MWYKKNKEVAIIATQKKKHKELTKDSCFFSEARGHGQKVFFLILFVQRTIDFDTKMYVWMDSGTVTHISMSMHSYLNCSKPNDGERYIYVGDKKTTKTFILLLKTDFILI